MKIFHSYLVFILTFTSITFNNISLAQDDSQKTQQLIADSEYNRVLNAGLKQLNRFEHTLEHLALIVYSEGSKFIQKDIILKYINDTRILIENVKASSFLVPRLDTIIIVQEINNALCKSLENATSLNKWNTIDLGQVVKRGQDAKLDLTDVMRLQHKNQITLESLETIIERFGLTSIQKTIRNLEDGYSNVKFYVEKHKLESYLKYCAISAVVSTYLIYQSDKVPSLPGVNLFNKWGISKIWDNPISRKIKSVIGSQPVYPKAKEETSPVDNQNNNLLNALGRYAFDDKYSRTPSNTNLGTIGWCDRQLNKYIGTELSPGVLIPGAALGWLSNQVIEDSMISTFGLLYLHPNPTMRMIASTNTLMQVIKANRYKDFKVTVKRYISNKYASLRGKSSKSSLAKKPTLTLKDVIGSEYAKKELETVIDYIINPEKFERTKLTPAKGYLMVGPPRTGKSYLAQAICGEINERQKLLGKPRTTSFISLDADLVNDKSFYKIMEYINSKAPCIVFMDEIDLLCLNRGDGNKENKLLSQILTHMSGYVNSPNQDDSLQNKQVIFIGATNNPHSLDGALLQPGRFGIKLPFEYPHLEERIRFIKHELKKRCITSLNDDFVEGIVKELEGYTFEDIFLVITGAIQKASSEYLPVSEGHFRSAIEEVIKKIIYSSKPLSNKEIKTIATYQSGKALATKLLTPDVSISTLTTMPINTKIESQKNSKIITTPMVQYGGIFTYKNTDLLNLQSNNELKLKCQILLAGHVAQELIFGSSFYTYRPEDQQTASAIAKQIALQGENYAELTKDLQEDVLRRAYLIKKECKKAVKELLQNNIELLKELNEALRKNSNIGENSINKILQK